MTTAFYHEPERLCRRYCNALHAGGYAGPLCPHCAHVTDVLAMHARVTVPAPANFEPHAAFRATEANLGLGFNGPVFERLCKEIKRAQDTYDRFVPVEDLYGRARDLWIETNRKLDRCILRGLDTTEAQRNVDEAREVMRLASEQYVEMELLLRRAEDDRHRAEQDWLEVDPGVVS